MKKILVIDDDAFVARLISAALQDADLEHAVDYCSDGGQGRLKAAQGGYDLISLDLAMPLMDGVAALAEMKQNPKSAHIPVVVITGHKDPTLHQRVMEMGATALLTKPFRAEEVSAVFRRILAGGQAVPAEDDHGLSPLDV